MPSACDAVIAELGALGRRLDRGEPSDGPVAEACLSVRGLAGVATDAALSKAMPSMVARLAWLADGGHGSVLPELREAFYGLGVGHVEIDLWTAQALVDAGRPSLALAMLEGAPRVGARLTCDVAAERAAYLRGVRDGLVGRAWKDVAVSMGPVGGRHAAGRALAAYEACCRSDEATPAPAARRNRRWGLTNRLALLWWLGDGRTPESERVAGECLEVVEVAEPEDWDLAARAEAHAALGAREPAVLAMRGYLDRCAPLRHRLGTLRQFEDLWASRHAEGPLTAELRDMLRVDVLASRGGGVEASAAAVARLASAGTLEAVYGVAAVTAESLSNLARTAGGVCQVVHKASGSGFATGFVVEGRSLREDWGAGPVLLTCSHAVCTVPHVTSSTRSSLPSDVAVRFSALPGAPRFDVVELWHSAPHDLDVTVLRPVGDGVERLLGTALVPDLATYGVAMRPAADAAAVANRSVFVVGHPQGVGDVRFSISNNEILSYGPMGGPPGGRYAFRYRAATRRGSSGSPVLDAEGLKVVGLHHLGDVLCDDGRLANQAVCLASVRRAAGA